MTKKLSKNHKQDGTLVIYTGSKGGVELRADTDKETIWATTEQIANIFGIDRSVVGKHVRNILADRELNRTSVWAKFAHTARDGKQYSVIFYNLDLILAIGYRTNSAKAIKFRQWATKTLRDYLVKGYVINTDRISKTADKFNKDLVEKIAFIQRTLSSGMFVDNLGRSEIDGILSIVRGYASSWLAFKEYDEGDLVLRRGRATEKRHFDYEFVRSAIEILRTELIKKNEAGDLFASERDGTFQGILKTIYQTFGSKELYPSLEEKAAHLLYFIIKDHPFSDGNKRVGAFLFVSFLHLNGILNRSNGEKKINDTALVALALLIAESDPKEKGVMVALTTNLLV